MRAKSHKPDYPLFVILLILIITGFLMLASASSVLSQEEFGQPYYFIRHQLAYGLLPGVLFGIVGYFMPLKFWRRFAPLFFFLSILFLILVFFPQFSYEAGGARRWLRLGNFSFQPSEFAKLAFIFYLSAWVSSKEKKIKSIIFGVFPFFVTLGVVGLLLFLQPDIGTLGIIAATSLVVIFVGGATFWHMVLLGLGGISAAWWLIKLAPYRLARIKTFLNPGADPLGISYQINQALIAIGSGGIFGVGLGQGRQKYNFLPQPISDSIFAIWSEEVGFIGAALVIAFFIFFIWRGLKIAKKAPDEFSKLCACGIVSWIGVQAFINIAAISGLLPLTGVPLPFMSYGGTSLAITLLASGILLNISKHTI